MLKHIGRSLKGRLLATAFLFLIPFLGLTGYILDHAFYDSAQSGLQERMKTRIYALLAAAEENNGKLTLPPALQDPMFNQLNSGIYGLVADGANTELWRSASAVGTNLDFDSATRAGQQNMTEFTNDQGEPLFALSYGIIWESEQGTENLYSFSVVQSGVPLLAEITAFRYTLWRWLGGIGLLLLALLSGIMHWGLAPLRTLAEALNRIEEGKQEQLEGNYPTELRKLTTNLNLLLANERRQRKRYRETLADLAHSLKTPLAVIRAQLSPSQRTEGIEEQIQRMDQIVTYQLQRASMPNAALSVKAIPIKPTVDKLLRNLAKVYADKNVSTRSTVEPESKFYGDERDLLEILGNLMDNAFKASNGLVALSARRLSNMGEDSLRITVEDDGPGIPETQRDKVLKRGIRADTRNPGQGIGLAVAADIIESYQGTLEIGASALGGASITICFNAPVSKAG